VLLKEQVAKLESQSKTDTKGKKKEKAGKSANLLAWIDDIPLESRMEDIDSYNERVFIAPKSNKTDVVKQIVDEMEVDNEDAVSLGNDSVYSNARDFYVNNALDGDDWDKYGDGLLNEEFANLNHTVPITEEMAKQPSSSSQRYSSNVVNTASYNKTVYTVKRVIKANEAKTSLLAEIEDDIWIIDSGASHHITTKLTDHTSYKPYPEPEIIQTANVHDSLKIHGEGTVFFNTETTNGQIHTVRLDNVCYIPNGSNRLLSRGHLCLEGLVEKADSKSTTFSLPTGRVFLRGFPRNETDTLHWVRSQIAHPNVPMAEPSLFLVNYNTWHLRMVHPSKNVLRHIGTNTNGFTPNLTFPLDSGICPGCAKGKMHNKPFPPSGKRAKQPFDLIHADLVQLPKKSYHKKEWACLLMDDYSSYAYCYLLRSKSEATSAITTFLELIKNQHTKVIKKFRSDHGGEFDNNSLDKIFASKGIVHEYSAPHIHTQNGRAEALNRIILEKAESMRTHAECPQSWWEFSFHAAVHIYNRTPLRRTQWSTPYWNIFGKKPDVQYFKTFGCLAWVYKPKEVRKHKLDHRSEAMTFIGYEIGSKAYKFMRKDNSICIATHAWFDEEKFLRANSGDGSSKDKLKICPPSINKDQEDDNYSTDPDTDSDHDNDDPHKKDSSDDTPSDLQEESSEEEESFESVDEEDEVEDDLKPPTESSDDEKSSTGRSRRSSTHSSNEKSEESSNHGGEPDQGPQSDSDDPFEESEPGPSGPRRSSRVPKPVIKYGSIYGDKPAIQIEKEIRSERAWQKAIEPKAKAIIKQAHNTFHDDLETLVKEGGNKSIHYLLAQAVDIEKNPRELQYRNILRLKDSNPKSFQEWQTAMEAEIKALNDRNVWELVNLPQNRRPIKCRWVYDIKTDGRKRGQLVAKGFSQIPGIDFEETFSPVARFETVRLLLALSALEDWEIEALDVKTAFLYGNLDEELYMEQPEGFVVKGQETKVYRLKKALYGLKQAAIAWNKQANKSLMKLGFKRCLSDTGVYTLTENNHTLVVVLYVDDVLFMGNNMLLLKEKKTAFMKMWECRDLGPISEYLRMKIVRDRSNKKLIIDQIDYAKKVVERFGQQNAKPTYVPLPVGYQPKANEGTAKPEQRSYYQSIIGSLLYLALGTRPDIVHAVIMMSQFMVNPSEDHINKSLHIIRYVNTNLNSKIGYDGKQEEGFIAYADADWASDHISRKSVTGYIIKLAGGAVSWVSRKQKTVALSSTEAEYMCLSDTTRQIVWIESLFKELNFDISNVALCGDNQGAIFLASNPAQEHRSKHIDIRYHYIRECVEGKKVILHYVPTTEQIADIMTKCLSYDKFKKFRNQLGITIP
jgi:hypothetical protein